MKSPGIRGLSAMLGLTAALAGSVALAQPTPPSRVAPPGAGAQPGQAPQIRRIDPSELPPQFRHPGGPAAPGGQLPPGAHGLPTGFNPRRPVVPVAHEEAEAEGHGEHEWCPGHGPADPPPPPNWWRGILTVNNERAKSDSFINQLLFRYENEKDPCDKDNMPPPFLATVINFGVLGFILYRFGRKPLAEALVKRKASIMHEIEVATKLKEDAERRLGEYEDQFERLDEKLSRLRAELGQQAEQEKKHLLAEAEERRARLCRDAEFRIAQELKSARAELLQQAVLAAAVAAEELLVKKVGASDLDRMSEDYLSAVGPAIKGQSVGAAAPGGR